MIKKRFTYKKVQKKSQCHIRAKSFFESDYFLNIKNIFTDKDIIETAEANGYKLCYKVHPVYKDFCKCLDLQKCIEDKFGKNSLLKATNILTDSNAIERNKKLGGHYS